MRPLVIVYVFGRMRYAPTVNCRDSVPTPWGSFPALGFCAHAVGKFSSLGIPCPRCGESFQPWDSAPTLWGSFPALGIRARAVGKLSSFGNPCPRCGEAFQLWESVPTPWGSFPALGFRAHAVGKLSRPAILCPRCGEAFAACDSVPTPWGSFRGYLLWSLEEAQRCVTAGERSEPAVIQTLNSGLRRSPIALSKRYSTSSKPIS